MISEQQRILVVDDEESMCEFLSILLERNGYKVTTTTSGKDAIALVKELNFDTIISDIKMPGDYDGLTVLTKVKEINPYIPVIMMTAYATMETAIEAVNKGAFYYFVKEGKPKNSEILFIVKRALEMREILRENVYLKRQLQDKFKTLTQTQANYMLFLEDSYKKINSNESVWVDDYHNGIEVTENQDTIRQKTKKGKKLLIKIGTSFPRFWKTVGFISVVTCFFASVWMLYSLFLQTQMLLAGKVKVGPGILIPSVTQETVIGPGYFAVPFWYWIISIFVLVVVHEGFHGIMAAREKVKITVNNKSEITFFFIPHMYSSSAWFTQMLLIILAGTHSALQALTGYPYPAFTTKNSRFLHIHIIPV